MLLVTVATFVEEPASAKRLPALTFMSGKKEVTRTPFS